MTPHFWILVLDTNLFNTQGFAFIYMEDERDADAAIRALDRIEFGRKGRRLRVEWTKQERGIRRPAERPKRSSRDGRPSKTLFVINFDTNHTRTRDLERHFEPYGKIVSVRIRRNFAFVQYESEDDASKALEATNMSKLLDRVISVEFAARDDDVRRNGHSPERSHDRQRDRSRDGRRSPSPYRRERGSPDYGHGPSPYKRQRSSPDYGHGNSRSRSPYRRERGSPAYVRRSISPYRRERDGSEPVRDNSRSPYHKERGRTNRSPSYSLEEGERIDPPKGHGSDHSPEEGERTDPKKDHGSDHSLEEGERIDPKKDHESDHSPYDAVKDSSENGHYKRHSTDAIGNSSPYNDSRGSPRPDAKVDPKPYNDYGGSPNTMPEPRHSPNYGGPESPIREQYRSQSQSPPAEE
ncbi:serine/arginine-rich splicing factor RS40-like isoform X2 [Vicia villosa]|uniref:serine/arginine-rich splicing factor RS40-like isoform X2 n=1 Tax=Vicia villosa TaxID=3911 RepID=UPI00273B0822|nr:serine/arginine-rich splicing factor RS40-like isoform X2 [Vicia villosa]